MEDITLSFLSQPAAATAREKRALSLLLAFFRLCLSSCVMVQVDPFLFLDCCWEISSGPRADFGLPFFAAMLVGDMDMGSLIFGSD